MMKSIICIGVITIAFLLSFTAETFATFTLVPSLTVREHYNDNIFLTDSDEEDDFITNITPRITFEYYPNRHLDLNLDYSLNYRFYADHGELDDTSLRETQTADFHARIRPLSRIYIDIDDTYGRVPVDARQKVAADNEFTNKTEQNIFRFSPYAELPITSTLLSRFGYRYTDTWYKADNGNDSENNSFFATITQKFPRNLSVSLNYDFSAVRPERTNDYDMHQGYVSAHYQVVSNLAVWGSIGKSYLDFTEASDEQSTFWDIGSEYKISGLGDSTLTATYSTQISESAASGRENPSGETKEYLSSNISSDRNSISTGVSEIKRFSLALTLRKYVELTVNPRYAVTEEIKTDREDEVKGIDISFRKPLSTKLTAMLDGMWEKQKFIPGSTKIRRYSLSGSFDYILSRYVTAGTGYRYNNRDSNVDGDDYENNIVWLEARVTF